jgi:hypothetical protein
MDVRFRCIRCNTITKNRSSHLTMGFQNEFPTTSANYSSGSSVYQHNIEIAKLRQENMGCKGCHNTTFVSQCIYCQSPLRGAGVYCAQCGHGGHAECLRSWFRTNDDCPTGCGCSCLTESVNGAGRNNPSPRNALISSAELMHDPLVGGVGKTWISDSEVSSETSNSVGAEDTVSEEESGDEDSASTGEEENDFGGFGSYSSHSRELDTEKGGRLNRHAYAQQSMTLSEENDSDDDLTFELCM